MMKFTKTSYDIVCEKYKTSIPESNSSKNYTSIELPTSTNNYVGLLNEYSQRNKLILPMFDYSRYNDMFVCRCELEMPNGTISMTSSPNTNKKNAKHDVCKKIYEIYLSRTN